MLFEWFAFGLHMRHPTIIVTAILISLTCCTSWIDPVHTAYAKRKNESCSVQVNSMCYDDELEGKPVKIIHGHRGLRVLGTKKNRVTTTTTTTVMPDMALQSNDQLQPKVGFDSNAFRLTSFLNSGRLMAPMISSHSGVAPLSPATFHMPMGALPVPWANRAHALPDTLMSTLITSFTNLSGSIRQGLQQFVPSNGASTAAALVPPAPIPLSIRSSNTAFPTAAVDQFVKANQRLPIPFSIATNANQPVPSLAFQYHPITSVPFVPRASDSLPIIKFHRFEKSRATSPSPIIKTNPLIRPKMSRTRETTTSTTKKPNRATLLMHSNQIHNSKQDPLLAAKSTQTNQIAGTWKPIQSNQSATVIAHDQQLVRTFVNLSIPNITAIQDASNRIDTWPTTPTSITSLDQLTSNSTDAFWIDNDNDTLSNSGSNWSPNFDSDHSTTHLIRFPDTSRSTNSTDILSQANGLIKASASNLNANLSPISHKKDALVRPQLISGQSKEAELLAKYPLHNSVEVYTISPLHFHLQPGAPGHDPTFVLHHSDLDHHHHHNDKDKHKAGMKALLKHIKKTKKQLKKDKKAWKKHELKAFKVRKQLIAERYRSNDHSQKLASSKYAVRRITLDMIGLVGYQLANYLGPLNTKYWVRLPNTDIVKDIRDFHPNPVTDYSHAHHGQSTSQSPKPYPQVVLPNSELNQHHANHIRWPSANQLDKSFIKVSSHSQPIKSNHFDRNLYID